jgi:large subunit ribosomal protein L22
MSEATSKSQRIKAKKEKRRAMKPFQLTACAKYLRCPTVKARLRARLLPCKGVEEALNILRNTQSSASKLIAKVLYSAMHNALNGQNPVDVEDLVVDKVMVDKSRDLKRIHHVSHGKPEAILKRTCHITVILRNKPLSK